MHRCMFCMKEYGDEYDMCPFCGAAETEQQKELYFLPLGTVIQNRYEIGISVGSGGFGITYKAWDRTLQKVVAIKEYYPTGLVNRIPGETELIIYSGKRHAEFDAGKARFLEEARNTAQFSSHPNIVNVFDFFEGNGTAYIVMELLEGITYKQYMNELKECVPVDLAVKVAVNVLSALTDVHNAGILHRDISPDNIFITDDGRTKILDFGAARFPNSREIDSACILKPGYAPPEQYNTKSKQDVRTDLYAVGATLYRALTNMVPMESSDREERDELREPIEINNEISVNLNNTIMRAMALQPELRFHSTKEFIAALTNDARVENVAKELKRRKRARLISLSVAGIIVLAVGAISLVLLQNKQQEAAVLKECSLEMWVQVPEGTSEMSKQNMMDRALHEFRDTYPQVELKIRCIPERDYYQELNEAYDSGNMPNLFESTNMPETYANKTGKVDEIFKFINTEEYVDVWKDAAFEENRRIPTSVNLPVKYINSELVDAGEAETVASQANSSEYNDFLGGRYMYMNGDITAYSAVQMNLPGKYGMEYDSNQTNLQPGHYFSVSAKNNKAEVKACVQVLVYLLAPTAQDVMYVQTPSELPMMISELTAFIDVNGEFESLRYLTEREAE